MENIKLKTVLLLLLLTSCTRATELLHIEGNYYSIDVAGVKRTFIVDLPENYSKNKEYSLALILHGGGGSSQSVRKFSQKVSNLDFIMVYPDGIEGNWRYNKGFENYSEDLLFIEKLVDVIKENYSIDSSRVYLGGISLGGLMTYSTGVYAPEDFAALGVISSALVSSFLRNSDNITSISLLHLHAKDDDVFLYDKAGLSALNSISKWRDINQASGEFTISYVTQGITKEVWDSSVTGETTQLITYSSGGHNYLPYSEDFLIDFFYNTPPRENRVTLNINSLKDFYIVNEEINIDIEIRDPNSVKEIVYTIDNEVVQKKGINNPTLDWIPKREGLYRLGAYVIQNSGKQIYSAISLDLLIVKPFRFGNFTADATSVEVKAFSPDLVVDGDLSTRWASRYSDDQILTIDLKGEELVNGVTVLWEDAFASSYNLNYSTDSINWTSIESSMDGPGPDFFDIGKELRYIRIRGDKRGTNWGYSIYEVLIH